MNSGSGSDAGTKGDLCRGLKEASGGASCPGPVPSGAERRAGVKVGGCLPGVHRPARGEEVERRPQRAGCGKDSETGGSAGV